jgi:hypothetical protein
VLHMSLRPQVLIQCFVVGSTFLNKLFSLNTENLWLTHFCIMSSYPFAFLPSSRYVHDHHLGNCWGNHHSVWIIRVFKK